MLTATINHELIMSIREQLDNKVTLRFELDK